MKDAGVFFEDRIVETLSCFQTCSGRPPIVGVAARDLVRKEGGERQGKTDHLHHQRQGPTLQVGASESHGNTEEETPKNVSMRKQTM